MINCPEAYEDARFDPSFDKQLQFRTRTLLCAPVCNRGGVVAVIEAVNKIEGVFDEQDEFMLRTISDELQCPLRRAALEQAFQGALQRAASDEAEFGYLLLFVDDAAARWRASSDSQHGLEAPLCDASHHEGLELATFDWDVTTANEDTVNSAVVKMLEHHGTLARHCVDTHKLANFLRGMRSGYQANAYHNFEHGVMVMHVSFVVLCKAARCSVLTALDIFALKVAALAHDVDHPGWNNEFEVNSASVLALRYNDNSVLENHHAAYLFDQLRRPDRDILETLGAAARREFRMTAIAAILATDMTHHGGLVERIGVVNDLEDTAQRGALASRSARLFEGRAFEPPDRRMFIVEVIIHLADMSNSAMPDFGAVKRWGARIIDEFTRQAARERHLGLPTAPFMRRLSTVAEVAQSQLAFVDYVVGPLLFATVELFPEIAELATNLRRNRAHWAAFVPKEVVDASTSMRDPCHKEPQPAHEPCPQPPNKRAKS